MADVFKIFFLLNWQLCSWRCWAFANIFCLVCNLQHCVFAQKLWLHQICRAMDCQYTLLILGITVPLKPYILLIFSIHIHSSLISTSIIELSSNTLRFGEPLLTGWEKKLHTKHPWPSIIRFIQNYLNANFVIPRLAVKSEFFSSR